jgi:hypothetical protein
MKQCLQKPVPRKQLFKAREQESGVIVPQWRKRLCKQNTKVKSHGQGIIKHAPTPKQS